MIIGIVGCGGIARAHVRALSLISAVKGLAFYEVSERSMLALSECSTLPVMFCRELKELALNSDGFIICTPNHLHVRLAEGVLGYKKIPFVCEKPLSTDLDSARRLVEIAPPGSIVSFNYRYNRVVQKIIEAQQANSLGELNFFSAEFNKNSAIVRHHLTWRDSALQSKSSGALGDLSCHLLDMFCLLSADTIRIDTLRVVKGTRIGSKSDGLVEVDDNGHVFGRSERGAFFRIRTSKSDEENELGLHINLVFDKGEIRYSTRNEDRFFLTFFDRLGVEEIALENKKLISDPPRELPCWSDSFYYLLQDWCFSLQGNIQSKTLPDLSAGLHIQEVMEAF